MRFRWPVPSFAPSLASASFGAFVALASCARPASPPPKPVVTVTKPVVDESTASITSFAVAPNNLSVDVIGMREGAVVPDGNRDLAFTTTLRGPIDALFLIACTERGEPLHHFRADTISGHEEWPEELGSIIEVGRLTEWIALVENGKFVNQRNGRIALDGDPHTLELYVPNTGMLRGGSYLRLYARLPSGKLIDGPVVSY